MEKKEIFKHIKEETRVVVFKNSNYLVEGYLPAKRRQELKWESQAEFLNSKEKYLEYYGDKLALVELYRHTVVIEQYDSKVSLKVFYYENVRYPGVHWFNKVRSMSFLTVNTKTGNMYTGWIGKLHTKKKKKKIHTNKFWSDVQDIFQMASINMYKGKVERDEFERKLKTAFVRGLSFDPEKNTLNTHLLFKHYLEKKGVKVPDNIDVFMTYHTVPTTKILKKAKYKFIDAVMLYNNIQGDQVKKVLHEIKVPPSLGIYKFICSLVGMERLHQDEKLLKHFLTDMNHSWANILDYSTLLSETEKKNIWKCIKDGVTKFIVLRDHAMFLHFLKEQGLVYRWKSTNEINFATEHKFLSDEYDRLKHGITNRIYPKEYSEFFRTPLEVGGIKYRIELLESGYSFHEESDYQQNCVKTYISRPECFILSVRSGKDRATVEYNIFSAEDEWIVDRVQFLGRFNKKLDEGWEDVLLEVDNKVKSLLFQYGYDLSLEKIRGDKKFLTTIEWGDKGKPKWEKTLELVGPFDYF